MRHAADIEAQAALWLARRDAGDTEAQRTEFAAWLAADARHRAAYLRLAAAWERSARLKNLRPDAQTIDPDLLVHRHRAHRQSVGRRPMVLAAGIAALAMATAWGVIATRGVQTYRTAVGGLSRVVLEDGSTVTLNTDSEVRVHFGSVRRQLTLLKGEAQFAVAHDRSRPFEVSTGGKVVRAVGTAFDVRLDRGESVEVVVTEGRVAFLDATGIAGARGATPLTTTVSAGESAVASGGKVTVRRISATESSRHLAWEVGELSFQGETLDAAVAEFNRYNRRKLRVEDRSIGNLQIGGNFQALEVDSFVAALNRSFGITARVTDDGTLILERAPRS